MTTGDANRGRARTLAVINAFVVVSVIAWNNWTAINGFRGRTVGGMSDRYDTLFTPAGYAFSIWGVIFVGLLANAGYLLHEAHARGAPQNGPRIGPWLILTNLANGLWIFLWLTEQTAASVVTLSAMFVFLGIAMLRLEMEIWDAPRSTIFFVWWPIVVYAGWVTVAVLANLSAFLAKHDVVAGDSESWAIAMIAVATIYNLVLIAKRNLREHAAVAIWALIAIAVARWGVVPSVQWVAVGAAGLLLAAVVAHGYRNRRTLPLARRSMPTRHET